MSAAAVLMPPLLVARVVGNLRRRGRHQGELLRCMPALAMISAAWMFGEAVGYLTGTAGSSLKPAAQRAMPVVS
jgi:hypothetical protein